MSAGVFRVGALAAGVVLFAVTLAYIDLDTAVATTRRLGVALPLALLFSGLWQLARTIAWAWCFPDPGRVSFARLARVRMAAEAFSYLTLRGIAGEPLKVLLLADRVDVRQATAAVALERIAYLIGTTFVVGAASAAALIWMPLTPGWFRVFRAFAIGVAGIAAVACVVVTGRGAYLQRILQTIDRRAGTSLASGRVGTFLVAVERYMLELVRHNPKRLAVLIAMTAAAYVCMALEAWIVLRAVGVPVGPAEAMTVETFSRVASFASAFIPANLGALEASSLAAAAAAGVATGGAALAIARRLRGLFWAAVGLAGNTRNTATVHTQATGNTGHTGHTGHTDNTATVRTQATGNTGNTATIHTQATGNTGHTGNTDNTATVRTQATGNTGNTDNTNNRQATGNADSAGPGGGTDRVLLYFPRHAAVAVDPLTRLAGLSIAERAVRAARRAGYGRVLVWLPPQRDRDMALRSLLHRIGGVEILSSSSAWADAIATIPAAAGVTAIGAGSVVSPAVFEAALQLIPKRREPIDVPAAPRSPESGVIRLTAADAIDPEAIVEELSIRRRRALPLPSGEAVANGHALLALRIVSAEDRDAAERTIRRSSYKDTDSKLAMFNRRLSLPISIALIPTPLTANQLSVILVALGFYAAWLFSAGHYWMGVIAAFLSLSASVLDGCDGEIARLKYQESALGCWIETVGDYSYYIAIFIGLTIGAVRQTAWEGFYWVGGIALAGTLLSFALLIFLRSRITAGRPEKLHTIARDRFTAEPTWWSRIIWRVSFCATRAAMPYGIMAFALLNLLPGIVVLAAIGANIYWISMVVKLRDLLGGDEEQRAAA